MDITIDNLVKQFGSHTVLDNIQLQVSDVHAVGILGPSGSGKTTLLRVLAGLEKPSSGKIIINNRAIPYETHKAIDNSEHLRNYRRRLGVVFQAFNLFPHLSALNNIIVPLVKVHQWKKERAKEWAMELLQKFSLDTHGHKHPHQLSGGQKQRVAICRAIAASPEFLLFDEPTSALDPDFIVEVLETIKGLKEICDFIIVTHHTGFARNISDYVLFLDQGNILEHGTPKQVYDNASHPQVKNYFDKVLMY